MGSGLLGMNFYHCVVVAVFGAGREGSGAVFVGAKITHRLVSSATTTCRVTSWTLRAAPHIHPIRRRGDLTLRSSLVNIKNR